ncbi:hypothetical protein [Dyadobacter luticola]|uniref:hypothetical protein n=1 Tax=Dyadobacter luticola TaxID=1979387 RepID=UPI00197AF2DF|nr:hypothetical protein [Dyadobacter luticola]
MILQNHFPDVRKMVSKKDTMATQTIKKDSPRQEPAFASGYTNAKVASHVSVSKSFVMPDLFLEQAEDMARFLDKNPVPERG